MYNFPVSWRVYVFQDNYTRETVDERADRGELASIWCNYTYGVDGNCKFAKFIKFQLIKNLNERVEFFGEMNFDACEVPFRIEANACDM